MTTTEYASPGAVNQHDGPLAIRRCRTCDDEIVFATSKRTGRRYPVSVSHGYKGQRFYMGHAFHTCQKPRQESAWQAGTTEQKMAATFLGITCG